MTLTLAAAGCLGAAALTTVSATAQDVRITHLDGRSESAVLTAITADGQVQLEGRNEAIPLAALTRIRRVDAVPAAPREDAGRVWLRSGAALGFADASASEDAESHVRLALSLEAAADPEAVGQETAGEAAAGQAASDIALEHLRAIRFASPTRVQNDAGFAAAVAGEAPAQDLVYAFDRNDQLKRYSLLVAGLDQRGLLVDAGGRVRPLPLERVFGVVFGAGSGSRPTAASPRADAPAISLSGSFVGGELLGAVQSWDGRFCKFVLAEGPAVTLPCAAIAQLRIDNGQLRYLSNYAPSDVQQTAALNRVQPWTRNRTQLGTGLVLSDTQYTNGLCLKPRTSLSWDLTGDLAGFDLLEAVVGIDDRSNQYADAVLRILADGKPVYEAVSVKTTTEAVRVSIALAGVQRITLETDFGDNLDVGDHCVFAEARLRKQ